jgi:hypothetical protein
MKIGEQVTRANLLTIVLLGMTAGCATVSTRSPPEIHLTNYAEVNLFGDSLNNLDDGRVAGFKLLTGKAAQAWGRYLCRKSGGNLSATELDTFRRNAVHPILILQPGQDTMDGSAGDGQTAAKCLEDNVADLRAHGGTDILPNNNLTIFLDVEQGTALSANYLNGLVSALQNDGFLSGTSTFGMYINASDGLALQSPINAVISNHGPISSVWYAGYLKNFECIPMPYWLEHNTPLLGKINVGNEMWQYAENCYAYGAAYKDSGFDISANKPPIYPTQ